LPCSRARCAKTSGGRTASPILVTGADGFVGRHLLAELGDDARALEADVRQAGELLESVRAASPVAIVHLAAVSSVGESWTSPGETWDVNAVGTVNLVEALLEARPAARLLLASTGEVYGRADELPTTEGAPTAPISPYAASKAAAEIACEQAARAKGLDVVVARAFQHEGPGRDDRFAIGSWTRQIAELELRGGGELLVGDLSAERDITDVRDVCRAYALLLDPSTPPGMYNVASGQKVGLTKVVDLLSELATCPVEVVSDPTRLRPVELPVVWGDASKLRAATGWKPEIPLQQTLADALDYARGLVTQEKVAKA
jgi:GDP-4-dehydro-6-deoxy-D-mannose reductase